MRTILLLIFSCIMISTNTAQQKNNTPTAEDQYRNVPSGGVLKSGHLPNINAFTADGKPIKLRDLCEGKYTVLTAGCLTCPLFHQYYPEIEAAFADYSNKGVQFYYFYKALRHPELDGYVQAQNMTERLMQLSEAQEKLGTKVPWIADTMDDQILHGLRSGSFSVYLISPENEIIYSSDQINRDGLRNALSKVAGAINNPTKTGDLNLPTVKRPAALVNEDSELGVKRPEGMTILNIIPTKPEETYYVKLRVEADDALLQTGTGRLFLGFYPDPIYDAHWNNLSAPMKFKLNLPKGVKATPSEASAKKGPGNSDTQPRQFWVDIKSDSKFSDIQLRLDYYGCTPDLCLPLTHEYSIQLKAEDRGSRTFGMNKGNKGNTREQARSKSSVPNENSRMQRMDANKDGSVSFEEMCEMMKKQRAANYSEQDTRRQFERLDSNKDGQISIGEMEKAPQQKK